MSVRDRAASESERELLGSGVSDRSAVLESCEREMGCPDENQLVSLLSGSLEPSLAATVRAHIDGCEMCRQAVAAAASLAVTPDGAAAHPSVAAATTLPLAGMDPIGLGATTPASVDPGVERRSFYVGQRIGERYRLEELLGEGGAGVVWAATHITLGRSVAIKFLKASSPELVRRFHREARITAMLRHPHVVDVHDVFDLADGTCAIVMDRLSGESLKSRFRREGAQPLSVMAQVLLPVTSALGAVHAQGVVHRDLKPENIFLPLQADGTWTVKVLDFGLAKGPADGSGTMGGKLTRTGALLGTPHYMAPEQVFAEKDIDARADLWALGVILYEGLAGQRPIDGSSFGHIFRQITVGEIVPLEARVPTVPPPIRDLVHHLLQRDRNKRPGDPRLVYDALLPYV